MSIKGLLKAAAGWFLRKKVEDAAKAEIEKRQRDAVAGRGK